MFFSKHIGDDMFRYLFGPVASRRLGISLGIDLFTEKTCSLNCIYCEAGRTQKLTMVRDEYVPFDDVVAELENYSQKNPSPDYVTFAGSGEPTLYRRIEEVILAVKRIFTSVKVAILTNGTLLSNPAVRGEIMAVDLVIPSLDAVSDAVFERINRPAPGLTVTRHIEGLVLFRNEYKGPIWLEIFIVPGINDTEHEIVLFTDAIKRIQPDRVQLNTLDRPAVEAGIVAAQREKLLLIRDSLAKSDIPVDIIARPTRGKQERKLTLDAVQNVIIRTISRRPCTMDDLEIVTGISERGKLDKLVVDLENAGLLEKRMEVRGEFYLLAGMYNRDSHETKKK